MSVDISFVVSAYNRPDHLLCCLASLKLQHSVTSEIIVTDNADGGQIQVEHREICEEFGVRYMHTKALTCYHSAEIGAHYAHGEYLAFPSDDSYYTPSFAKEMLATAKKQDADLVISEMVYSPRYPGDVYRLLNTAPVLNAVDKTGFILKRSRFYGFPDKTGGYCAADGLLIERLIREGISYAKYPGVAVVHN